MKRIKHTENTTHNKFLPEQLGNVNFNQVKPKISFEFLNGEYCISKCEKKEKAEIIDTLHQLSQKTWQEIIQSGKNGIGYERIELSQLKCRYPHDRCFQNIDKATIFHHKKSIPIIGFRTDNTYYIFCIDRNYKAYKHGGS